MSANAPKTPASRPFVPILLGTEIAGYGMARAFYERYGARSVVYGTFPLTPTSHSKFIEVRIDPEFSDPDHFVEVLNADAERYRGKVALVVPCGDDYALLLARVKHRLDPVYACVCPEPEVIEALLDKAAFYGQCEKTGVSHPATVAISGPEVPELPFGSPYVLKPADPAAYRAHPFEGQKKAYVLSDRAQLERTARLVYEAGYPGQMIVQDFVPGDDDRMRVVNGYVREDGTVTLIALGHPLLEDYSPMAIGNYAAILSYGDDGIYDMVEKFMRGIPYRGFFNIDMKYDERDGSYRLFEVNPRAGRSSFFATLAGHNLAQYAVDDFVDGGRLEPVRAFDEVLWLGIPRSVFRRYTPDSADKRRALELISQGKVGTTLFGAGDRDPRRLVAMGKLWLRYVDDYRRYFGDRELDA